MYHSRVKESVPRLITPTTCRPFKSPIGWPDVSFGARCREIPLMKPGRRSPGGMQPTLLLPSRSIELTVAKPGISRAVPLIRARFSYRHEPFYHPIMQLVNRASGRKLAPGDRMRLLKSAANLQVITLFWRHALIPLVPAKRPRSSGHPTRNDRFGGPFRRVFVSKRGASCQVKKKSRRNRNG